MKRRWPPAQRAASVSSAELLPALRERFAGLRRMAPLREGRRNLVLRLDFESRPSQVAKVYLHSDAKPEREAAIVRLVADRILTPSLTTFEVSVGGRVMAGAMMPLIRGASGYKLLQASPGEGLRHGREIGRVLAAIHGFAFAQYGLVNRRLEVERALDFSGGGILAGIEAHLCSPVVRERLAGVDCDRVLSFVRDACVELDRCPARACLVHSDYGLENLMIDEGGGVWVLDWEFAHAGHPLTDLGHLLRPELGERREIVGEIERGYREAGGRLPGGWRTLARLLDLVAWFEFLDRREVADVVVKDARWMIEKIATSEGL